jgi:hypothetical protein
MIRVDYCFQSISYLDRGEIHIRTKVKEQVVIPRVGETLTKDNVHFKVIDVKYVMDKEADDGFECVKITAQDKAMLQHKKILEMEENKE